MNQHRASTIFWCVAAAYCLFWTVLPSWIMPGYLLDVPEMIFVGKEWVIGYHKHPTLPTWFLQIFELLTNRAHFAPFLASQVCVFACFWASWRTARRFFSEEIALLSTFSMVGYYYYAYQSTEYNHHLPLMACVGLTTFFLICAFEENKFRWWLATGAMIGCGMLCKYPMVLLAGAIVIFMLVNRQARVFWRQPGPYLSILAAALIFLPHFIWLVQNDFTPLEYANKHLSVTYIKNITSLLEFVFFNFLIVLPTIICLLPLTSFRWKPQFDSQRTKFHFALLFTLTVGVFLLFAFIGMLKNVNLSTAFCAQIWPLFGVFWAFGIRQDIQAKNKITSVVLMAGFAVIMCAVLLVGVFIVPFHKNRPTRFLFPAAELAQIAENSWGKYYSAPCPYVAGEWWIAANAAMKMKSDPRVFAYMSSDNYEDNSRLLSSWATREDVRAQGGLFFWNADRPQYENGIPQLLFTEYPNAILLPRVSLKYYRTEKPLHVGMAIVPKPERQDTAYGN